MYLLSKSAQSYWLSCENSYKIYQECFKYLNKLINKFCKIWNKQHMSVGVSEVVIDLIEWKWERQFKQDKM